MEQNRNPLPTLLNKPADTPQKIFNFQSLSSFSVFLFHFEFLVNTNHFSDL